MALFKVQVIYETARDNPARCTMVLTADSETSAHADAERCVRACSLEGVKTIRHITVTRNSLGVEFLGRQPT